MHKNIVPSDKIHCSAWAPHYFKTSVLTKIFKKANFWTQRMQYHCRVFKIFLCQGTLTKSKRLRWFLNERQRPSHVGLLSLSCWKSYVYTRMRLYVPEINGCDYIYLRGIWTSFQFSERESSFWIYMKSCCRVFHMKVPVGFELSRKLRLACDLGPPIVNRWRNTPTVFLMSAIFCLGNTPA